MGQYYKAFNATKGEYISPYEFDNFYKLIETCYVGNWYVDALTWLLANDWRGDTVFLCGDYAWDELGDVSSPWSCSGKAFLNGLKERGIIGQDPWELANGGAYTSAASRVEWSGERPRSYRYVANATRAVFYDRETLPKSKELGGLKIDPLTLYLACGNGLGGGDFHGKGEDEVGTWAGEDAYGCDERPEGFAEIELLFRYSE